LTAVSRRDTVRQIALFPAAHKDVAEGRLCTLGCPFLALLLQAEEAGLPQGSSVGILERIASSDPVAKFVLLCLGLLSIVSWGIIFYKLWVFRESQRQSSKFLEIFRRSSKFSEVQAACGPLGASPLVGLFQSGYTELTAQLRQHPPAAPDPASPRAAAGRPTLKSLAAVDRALTRASVVEMNKLEQRVSFLATTASIAPFIGLFGTVWGIMTAFLGISQTGSTNLGVVAPGIAQALVATAFGLAAAIPAVLFYNAFAQRVKLFGSEMDDFAMEFLNIAERNFT
jgi:biopolymer transport protein TolQ